MKNIFVAIVLALFIVGCGNSKNMTIFDNGNGTRTPRISKVLQIKYYQGTDRNETKTIEIGYVYNNDNMLVQKNLVEDVGYATMKYLYNDMKQIIQYVHDTNDGFGGNAVEYEYSDTIIDSKWKLPILEFNENIFYFHGDIFKRKTTYEYTLDNDENVQKIISSYNTQTMILYRGGHVDNPPDKHTTYFYDENERIIKIINDSVATNFYYNEADKLTKEESEDKKTEYMYDKKGLMIASVKYEKFSSTEWKIVESNKYFYENKKYFSTFTPSEFDQGQYFYSGIY